MIVVTKWKSIQLKEWEVKPSSRQLKCWDHRHTLFQHWGRGSLFWLLLKLQGFLQLSQWPFCPHCIYIFCRRTFLFWFKISDYDSFVRVESSPLLRTETSASTPEVQGTWRLLARDNGTESLWISLEFIPLMSRTSPGLLVFIFWALLQPWGWLWPRNWSF